MSVRSRLALQVKRRQYRVRNRVTRDAHGRPRLSVFRSNRHMYAQIIDDAAGTTLVSVSSFEKGNHKRATTVVCTDLGKVLAERCKAKNITSVVFDKNGFMYHGRVKALAEGAREGGLEF